MFVPGWPSVPKFVTMPSARPHSYRSTCKQISISLSLCLKEWPSKMQSTRNLWYPGRPPVPWPRVGPKCYNSVPHNKIKKRILWSIIQYSCVVVPANLDMCHMMQPPAVLCCLSVHHVFARNLQVANAGEKLYYTKIWRKESSSSWILCQVQFLNWTESHLDKSTIFKENWSQGFSSSLSIMYK